MDLRPAVRNLETHSGDHRRGAGPGWRLQPRGAGGRTVSSSVAERSRPRRTRRWRPCPRRAGEISCPARRVRSQVVRQFAVIVLNRDSPAWAWQLTSALLLGVVAGQIAAVVAKLALHATMRPDVVVALVVGIPGILGMLMVLASARRWVTALGPSSWRWVRDGFRCSY